MSSPHSDSEKRSKSFDLLDERIQRWIWQAGWTELRDTQETAIPAILAADRDVIISAATASGKTEAAFFPILTYLLGAGERACVLYISPLKALINDQWRRLDQLCELLDIPVIPWHGDASETAKKRFLKRPGGCLLITPESLEGILIRHGHGLGSLFGELAFIVVDELHAFIDTERGKQLQSLMQRIELVLSRKLPRIGLSATLGNMQLAAEFLRPGAGCDVQVIESREGFQELKVIVKGYRDLAPESPKEGTTPIMTSPGADENRATGEIAVSIDLFRTLRGTNNLVFPNSRRKVEIYSDLLRRRCEREGLPNEFWPHHGSLSKEIREETERALKAGDRPVTAIATTTLELGIDIGAVKSIAQIGPAPSVASLRQRLGRSGRRKGEPAILRCYCLDAELKPDTPISDRLRESLVQTIAQIRLLVKGWYEPPRISGMHLSTLIQQVLSLIAQYGGVDAAQAWSVLCASGVFRGLSKQDFAELLRGLGSNEILMQDATGLLLHGPTGERIVNHYSFLAAFAADEEFRVFVRGKTLGSLPLSRPVETGSYVIFAGRRWKVLSCNPAEKYIEVEPAKGGKPPLFDGMVGKVHDQVREEMRAVLTSLAPIPFLDVTASKQLEEGRRNYAELGLSDRSLIQSGADVHVFTWKGDWVNDTLSLLLSRKNMRALNEGIVVTALETDVKTVFHALRSIADEPPPSAEALAETVRNKLREKWDHLLAETLLNKTYASRELDIPGACSVARGITNTGPGP
ncbi:MAG: DEAD/DEAH box helicase [Desulfobacteraceae bacterium]|nr:MAG: DEAD/DEAH box helicase [Desulfobacteraceae bacterium]